MSIKDFTECLEQNIKVYEEDLILAGVQIKSQILQKEMIELQLRVTALERRKVDEI